jgi:SAP domain/CS domain
MTTTTTLSVMTVTVVTAFSPHSIHSPSVSQHHHGPTGGRSRSSTSRSTRSTTPLYSGDGIATDYRWHEEAFEIEVTVQVPKDTKAKDIYFKAKADSIDLRLMIKDQDDNNNNNNNHQNNHQERYLLDPTRPLRGKVVLDGTFWVISDPEITQETTQAEQEDPKGGGESPSYREVTVTIEKQIRTPQDDFDVVDYDWNGLYKDDEEEVTYRKYDQPEELDVREYAASLGVDIDNLNMSLVDKSMFSSGLNITKSSFDSLQKAGLMKEVTRQEDGSEWITDDDGQQVPFSSYGQAVSKDESQSATAATTTTTTSTSRQPIPFLDTDSPWHTAVPIKQAAETASSLSTTAAALTSAADDESPKRQSNTTAEMKRKLEEQAKQKEEEDAAVDPISILTVARLREILKQRGLKVSGNKTDLQDRLRAEVQSMMIHDADQQQ